MFADSGGRKVSWILVLAVMCVAIAAAFSVQWALPMFAGSGPDTYVPVRYAPHSISDDYFYFTFIRDVIDRGLSYGDPLTFEHSGITAMHDTYKGSLALAALGGIFTGRTEHAYVLAYAIFPPLNFILLYILVMRIVERRALALLLATVCTFAYTMLFSYRDFMYSAPGFLAGFFGGGMDIVQLTSLSRVPNVLVTNLHLCLTALALHGIMEREDRSALLLAGTFALLSVSSYMSVQNFIMSYAFVAAALLLMRDNRRPALALAAVAALSIIPGIWGIRVIMAAREYMHNITGYTSGAPYYILGKFYFREYVYFLLQIALPVAFVSVFTAHARRFVLGIGLATLGCYLVMAVFGSYTSRELYSRGGQLLFVTVMLSAVVRAVLDAPGQAESVLLSGRKAVAWVFGCMKPAGRWLDVVLSKKLSGMACVALAFLLAAGVISNQILIYKDKADAFHDHEFTALSSWARANSGNGEVAVTMDFDLVMHLPVYTPLNVYIPEAIMSPASHDERYSRFAETAAFYGLDRNILKGLLGSLPSHLNMPELWGHPDGIRLALMNLGLFYSRFSAVAVDEGYKNRIAGFLEPIPPSGRLSRKADYLIVSDFDRKLLMPGSAAWQYAARTEPVYRNGRYSVFRLK